MPIKDGFYCYGHFYDMYKEDSKIAKCRSVLEIIRKNSSLSANELSLAQPNAIAIMMNPGKSYPENSQPERINIEEFNIDFLSKSLVLTNPDDTQTRIMKIMNNKRWNHVRVLNLSDIREEDSKKLGGLIRDFELRTQSNLHSIFSNSRYDEMIHALSNNRIPILLAWGTEECIENHAEFCLSLVNSRRTFGVPSSQSEYYFHHPLTRRISWYSRMIDLLEGL
ncbi:DUF1643 domain-containing protein [Halobacillus litoralis]|uniref:DUF1643 domain-containing protein n=1 Tax=Halobacillus litoralis TaxID=45668 RepID=UPI001CFC5522|nr:DUF1643 domain-containing protein [Halobacillus litoralis]